MQQFELVTWKLKKFMQDHVPEKCCPPQVGAKLSLPTMGKVPAQANQTEGNVNTKGFRLFL